MVERRKPLILSSTKTILDSVLNHSPPEESTSSDLCVTSPLRLTAGILHRSENSFSGVVGLKAAMPDDSALIGVSMLALKRLSVTSGSLVLVKNVETRVGRVGTVVVLDPPAVAPQGHTNQGKFPSQSQSQRVMAVLPSLAFPPMDQLTLDREVAYLSPSLSFNLGLHVSCWKVLVHGGKESLQSLFYVKESESNENEIKDSSIFVELLPWSRSLGYASHLRVSFVRIPECGTLESLRGSSLIEAEDRQDFIDSALHDYFKVDRYLSKGDVFCIEVNWNCNSPMCISCSKKTQKDIPGIVIHFKVVAMEPSNEPFLRVNCHETALVLGGSVSSPVLPDSLIGGSKGCMPLQGDIVNILASVLTPALCPSILSLKFRVAILLYGLAGCGKRTVVRYVARRLGLHVVEYSCHDLLTSSERKASVALETAFSTAKRYAPAIILLRHFHLFTNLSSNEVSPNDQAGITSEVASVIREFTEPISEDQDLYSEEKANVGSVRFGYRQRHLSGFRTMPQHISLIYIEKGGTIFPWENVHGIHAKRWIFPY